MSSARRAAIFRPRARGRRDSNADPRARQVSRRAGRRYLPSLPSHSCRPQQVQVRPLPYGILIRGCQSSRRRLTDCRRRASRALARRRNAAHDAPSLRHWTLGLPLVCTHGGTRAAAAVVLACSVQRAARGLRRGCAVRLLSRRAKRSARRCLQLRLPKRPRDDVLGERELARQLNELAVGPTPVRLQLVRRARRESRHLI